MSSHHIFPGFFQFLLQLLNLHNHSQQEFLDSIMQQILLLRIPWMRLPLWDEESEATSSLDFLKVFCIVNRSPCRSRVWDFSFEISSFRSCRPIQTDCQLLVISSIWWPNVGLNLELVFLFLSDVCLQPNGFLLINRGPCVVAGDGHTYAYLNVIFNAIYDNLTLL